MPVATFLPFINHTALPSYCADYEAGSMYVFIASSMMNVAVFVWIMAKIYTVG
jgi:hypothetical protein